MTIPLVSNYLKSHSANFSFIPPEIVENYDIDYNFIQKNQAKLRPLFQKYTAHQNSADLPNRKILIINAQQDTNKAFALRNMSSVESILKLGSQGKLIHHKVGSLSAMEKIRKTAGKVDGYVIRGHGYFRAGRQFVILSNTGSLTAEGFLKVTDPHAKFAIFDSCNMGHSFEAKGKTSSMAQEVARARPGLQVSSMGISGEIQDTSEDSQEIRGVQRKFLHKTTGLDYTRYYEHKQGYDYGSIQEIKDSIANLNADSPQVKVAATKKLKNLLNNTMLPINELKTLFVHCARNAQTEALRVFAKSNSFELILESALKSGSLSVNALDREGHTSSAQVIREACIHLSQLVYHPYIYREALDSLQRDDLDQLKIYLGHMLIALPPIKKLSLTETIKVMVKLENLLKEVVERYAWNPPLAADVIKLVAGKFHGTWIAPLVRGIISNLKITQATLETENVPGFDTQATIGRSLHQGMACAIMVGYFLLYPVLSVATWCLHSFRDVANPAWFDMWNLIH